MMDAPDLREYGRTDDRGVWKSLDYLWEEVREIRRDVQRNRVYLALVGVVVFGGVSGAQFLL